MRGKVILLVEDNPDDVELTLRAFEKNNLTSDVIVARDGVEALDHLLPGAASTRVPNPALDAAPDAASAAVFSSAVFSSAVFSSAVLSSAVSSSAVLSSAVSSSAVSSSAVSSSDPAAAAASAPAQQALPELVLLDLNLPRISGLEVLRRMRAEPRTRRVPVVVLTSSQEEKDIQSCYDLGANSFVQKPVDYTQFVDAARQLSMYWLELNQSPNR